MTFMRGAGGVFTTSTLLLAFKHVLCVVCGISMQRLLYLP